MSNLTQRARQRALSSKQDTAKLLEELARELDLREAELRHYKARLVLVTSKLITNVAYRAHKESKKPRMRNQIQMRG